MTSQRHRSSNCRRGHKFRLSFTQQRLQSHARDSSFQQSWRQRSNGHFFLSFLEKERAMMMIIPVSTVPCARGFSVQNRIKTHGRNHLNEGRVSNLMTLNIHKKLLAEFDFDAATTSKFFQLPEETAKIGKIIFFN